MQTQNSEYKKVVVAIDVFASYEPVLARAIQVAGSSAIQLVYVSVPQMYFEPFAVNVGHEFATEIQDKAQAKIEQIAQQNDIPADNTHVLIGYSADEIHSFAEQQKADLIILGTHGRSGLKLLLGSTANAVLHGAKCDVLAVKV